MLTCFTSEQIHTALVSALELLKLCTPVFTSTFYENVLPICPYHTMLLLGNIYAPFRVVSKHRVHAYGNTNHMKLIGIYYEGHVKSTLHCCTGIIKT